MEAEDFVTQAVASGGVRGREGEPLSWVNTIRMKNRCWKNEENIEI